MVYILKNMPSEEYLLHQEIVIELLNFTRRRIHPEALRGVEHYLEHGELEIAFELLCLEVVNENIDLPQDKEAQLLALAEKLLDPISANDPNVLEKLNAYASKNN